MRIITIFWPNLENCWSWHWGNHSGSSIINIPARLGADGAYSWRRPRQSLALRLFCCYGCKLTVSYLQGDNGIADQYQLLVASQIFLWAINTAEEPKFSHQWKIAERTRDRSEIIETSVIDELMMQSAVMTVWNNLCKKESIYRLGPSKMKQQRKKQQLPQ